MEAFLSSLVSVAFHGIAYGMILYVISVGLSVTMGLMGFVNLCPRRVCDGGGYILTRLSSFRPAFSTGAHARLHRGCRRRACLSNDALLAAL
jgi:branched-subunit amino acid ABC-type transport system permease component